MFKKYMAAILACVLTLALSVPMFAGASSAGGVATPREINGSSSTASGNIELTYDAMMKIPILLVKVTNNGALILNPYRLQYDHQDDTDFTGSAEFNFGEIGSSAHVANSSETSNPLDGKQMTFRQIISSPLIIESKTVVPIKVGVEVSCTVTQRGSNAKQKIVMAATRPITGVPKPDTTKKTVCMWMASGVSAAKKTGSSTYTAGTAQAATVNARLVDPFDSTKDYNAKTWTGIKPYLILSETKANAAGVKNAAIMKIPAAVYNSDTSQSSTSNLNNAYASYGVLMFDGEMIPMPVDTTGALEMAWNTDDVIKPTVKINLQCMPNPITSSEVMHDPWHSSYEG